MVVPVRSGRILPFRQTRVLYRRSDHFPSAAANAPNAPRTVLLEMSGILAAALGIALGINLLLLAFHIA
jgi:hypothetical protein